ncbi:MAG: aspartate aminotransferase family protein [Gammaproteobacteria bacterium]
MNTDSQSGMQRATRRYLDATPKSRALAARARARLPDGLSRNGQPFQQYPMFVERGAGAYLHDVDGRAVLDLSNGHSGLPLGHAHPLVMQAVREQLDRGLGFAVMEEREVELAERLCARIPGLERIRFTASGGEATMFALRLARAFTRRTLFARMEGSYHGMHDMMCSGPGLNVCTPWPGTEDDPVSLGVSPSVRDEVVYLPFNDADECERRLAAHGPRLAAIIVEPIQSAAGCIVPGPGFLQRLRTLCDRHGALLVFDEMVSIGVAYGGAQAYYGVQADLFASGKLIGGSMPMGVFGGRADVMALLETRGGVPPVYHSGTWNGHPLSMAAGIAQMDALTPPVYERLGRMGEDLRAGIAARARRRGVALQITGVQHFTGLHYMDRPVNDHRDALCSNFAHVRNVAFSLLSQGFYITGTRINLSDAMTRADLERFLDALEIAFEEAGAATR